MTSATNAWPDDSQEGSRGAMRRSFETSYSAVSVWNKFLTSRLIDLWWERPALYDSTLDEYKDKVKRNQDVADIAEHLGVDDRDVRKKMNNLRRQYAREKALLEKSRKNITINGEGMLYESNWFYYSKMAFLDNFVNTKTYGSKAATDLHVKIELAGSDSSPSNGSDEGMPLHKNGRYDIAETPAAGSEFDRDPIEGIQANLSLDCTPLKSVIHSGELPAQTAECRLDSSNSVTPLPVSPGQTIGTLENAPDETSEMHMEGDSLGDAVPGDSAPVLGPRFPIARGKTRKLQNKRRVRQSRVPTAVAGISPAMIGVAPDDRCLHNRHEQLSCSSCDGDSIFGHFVAQELRQITDQRVKRLVKFKVHAAIMEAYSYEQQ